MNDGVAVKPEGVSKIYGHEGVAVRALDKPSEGRIWVAGTEIGGLSKAVPSALRLRRIGFVFQEFNLIPVLSALENVEFVMLLQGVPPAERRARSPPSRSWCSRTNRPRTSTPGRAAH